MEPNKIQSANIYVVKNMNVFDNKSVATKKPNGFEFVENTEKLKDTKADDFKKHLKDLESKGVSSNKSDVQSGIRVSFTVEKDLNIIVTKVLDGDTKKVLRQIPSADEIKRRRLVKIYNQHSSDNGVMVDQVMES